MSAPSTRLALWLRAEENRFVAFFLFFGLMYCNGDLHGFFH
jgi:hypothetical protein